ncbi:MAG: TrkH family potassium uptake protein, partial [Blautia sp.]|nr:TrkH family potassium uptake protein [Blautia sp.]
SIDRYSNYIQVVTTIFMIIFGVNFTASYLISNKKWKPAILMEEIRYYFLIILGAIVMITLNVRHLFPNLLSAFHHTAFQVASIITTTGFSTKDFDLWPSLSKTILVGLMFIGACAGSTGGGFKVSRIVILIKAVRKEIQLLLHPSAIKKVKMDGKAIPHETVRTTNIFLTVYLLIFAFSVFLISFENKDLVTNFTAVAATFNNIGPGLSTVGPALNFAHLSWFSKCVLIVDMLAGRLEIFPLLVLCSPRTWKKF